MVHAPDSASAVRPWTSGAGLVVGLVALGCCLGGFAVWFQWQQTRRCLSFYGPEIAAAISLAPRVEIWEIEPAGTTTRFRVARRIDASRAAGLVHLRRGLVEDGNFDWNAPAMLDPRAATDWRVAIAFFSGDVEARPAAVIALAIDAQGRGAATVPGRPGRVALGRIGTGLRAWLGGTQAGSSGVASGGEVGDPERRQTPEKGG